MINFIENYYKDLSFLIPSIRVTDNNECKFDFYHGIERACSLIASQIKSGRKLIFIGNGASASISSHISTDFWKNGGMRAVAFNDSSLLTCISNDYGYEYVFAKPIEMFAEKGDILIAVSSSGKSENILRGVRAARERQCTIITLSGFHSDNPLSSMGNLNFYVPSSLYGPVEIMHHSICHCILDAIINAKNG